MPPAGYNQDMELHLDTIQASTLRDLLDSTWGDLRYEIADTDNAAFKAGLRERERIIVSILEQLTVEAPAPGPGGGD